MRQRLNKLTVIKAAADLADREGFEKVTLSAVADKLKVRTPSLYNHVEGLPGLKKELACYAIKQMKEEMVKAAIGRSGREALFAIGISYVSFARRCPGLYKATMGAPDPKDLDIQKAEEETVSLLLRVLEGSGLDQKSALHRVRGLRSMVHGFASLELNQGFSMDLDRDESLRDMLNTYLAGIWTKSG